MSIIRKIPWWGWVGAVIIIVVVWQSFSGWAMSRRLYNVAIDQLREDQSSIVQQKDEWIRAREKQILDFQGEIDKIRSEKVSERAKAAESAAEVVRLREKIYELQFKIDHIIVSNDPDRIIDSLRRQGIRSIRIH